jgi:hypothetical protein
MILLIFNQGVNCKFLTFNRRNKITSNRIFRSWRKISLTLHNRGKALKKLITLLIILYSSISIAAVCKTYNMPSDAALLDSSKEVFAHYFHPFPLSTANEAANEDYYNTEWLNPDGENGAWSDVGGYLRQRPLGVVPSDPSTFKVTNMRKEIAMAINRGITGFTFDVLDIEQATNPDSEYHNLLTAAEIEDSRFKIMIMPDMTALGDSPDDIVAIVTIADLYDQTYRLADGRLVLAPFAAEHQSASFWKGVISELEANDIAIAFMPVFIDAIPNDFIPLVYGYGYWGTATASSASDEINDIAAAHAIGKKYFQPIMTQQYRPKDSSIWESNNSSTLRNGWASAINGGADFVQIVTWNDFSESGQISSYTDASLNGSIGTGFYNITGYYAAKYLTGSYPTINGDAINYFYRKEPPTAAHPNQPDGATFINSTPSDKIEVVAFLTSSAQVKITTGGTTTTFNGVAGVNSFKVTAKPGNPNFKIVRNNVTVLNTTANIQIYGQGGLPSRSQDLTYWSGSYTSSGLCTL